MAKDTSYCLIKPLKPTFESSSSWNRKANHIGIAIINTLTQCCSRAILMMKIACSKSFSYGGWNTKSRWQGTFPHIGWKVLVFYQVAFYGFKGAKVAIRVSGKGLPFQIIVFYIQIAATVFWVIRGLWTEDQVWSHIGWLENAGRDLQGANCETDLNDGGTLLGPVNRYSSLVKQLNNLSVLRQHSGEEHCLNGHCSG